MPRPVAWLLLILAFTGPLLTHAEAADDLERFLIESGDLCEIEPPDGGVGDDPVVVSAWKVGPTLDSSGFAPLGLETAWTSPPTGHFSIGPGPSRRHRAGSPWRYPAAPRRYALLQHFLI